MNQDLRHKNKCSHPCITCKTTYYWDSSKTLEKEEYLGELKFTTKGVDERFTYKYELDYQKNWINMIKFENNKPTYITERIFEYYE